MLKYRDPNKLGTLTGAGYDCILHEIHALANNLNRPINYQTLNFFEIDAPPTQTRKLEIIHKQSKLKSWNSNIQYLSVDFQNEDFLNKMQDNFKNFNPKKPTLYIWEGVAYYLSEAAVFNTLKRIKQEGSPGNSYIIHDMFCRIHEKDLDQPQHKMQKTVMRNVEILGEPMHWLLKKEN